MQAASILIMDAIPWLYWKRCCIDSILQWNAGRKRGSLKISCSPKAKAFAVSKCIFSFKNSRSPHFLSVQDNPSFAVSIQLKQTGSQPSGALGEGWQEEQDKASKGSTSQKPHQKEVQPVPAIHESERSDILQSLPPGNGLAEKSRGISSSTLLTLKTYLQLIGMAPF